MKYYKQVRYTLGWIAQLLFGGTALGAFMAIAMFLFGAAFPQCYDRTTLELIEIAAQISLGCAALLVLDTLITIVLNFFYNRRNKQ